MSVPGVKLADSGSGSKKEAKASGLVKAFDMGRKSSLVYQNP